MSDMGDCIASELRETHTAIRLQTKWMGVNKALSKEQRTEAAQCFSAEGSALSASKRLLDTKHEAWRDVSRVKREAKEYFERNTLPFPEKGIRLMRREKLDEFQLTMTRFLSELDQSVAHLQTVYWELRESARRDLGELWNEADYPERLEGEFSITWDYPSVEPPDYLQDIAPRLFKQQQDRVAQRFNQAIESAEASFMDEFGKLVNHLAERLRGDHDGRPKVFYKSTLTNLTEFFEHFRSVSVRSNADLDALVDRAQNVTRGLDFDSLRDNGHVQDVVRESMSQIGNELDQLMELKPKRGIFLGDE